MPDIFDQVDYDPKTGKASLPKSSPTRDIFDEVDYDQKTGKASVGGAGSQSPPRGMPPALSRVASNFWDEISTLPKLAGDAGKGAIDVISNPGETWKAFVADKTQAARDLHGSLSKGDYGGAASAGLRIADPLGFVSKPVSAAVNILKDQDALRIKAVEAAKRGDYSNATRHAIEYATPLIGPAISARGDQAASGDVAGAIGGTLGIGGTTVLPIVGSAALKATKAVARRAAPVIADALEESAAKSYRRVLAPSAKGTVADAERTAAALAKQKPIAMTREGLKKQMVETMNDVGPKTKTAYAGKPPVDANPILKAIDQFRRDNTLVKGTNVVVNDSLDNALMELQGKVRLLQDETGRISASALDDFKDKLFKGNVDGWGHLRQNAPQTARQMERKTAGAIKGYLDELFPDAKAINESYGTAKSAYNYLEEGRRKGIASEGARHTGTVSGAGAFIHKAIPRPLRWPLKALEAFDSPAWHTTAGASKQRLAELLRGAPPPAPVPPAPVPPAPFALLESGSIKMPPIPESPTPMAVGARMVHVINPKTGEPRVWYTSEPASASQPPPMPAAPPPMLKAPVPATPRIENQPPLSPRSAANTRVATPAAAAAPLEDRILRAIGKHANGGHVTPSQLLADESIKGISTEELSSAVSSLADKGILDLAYADVSRSALQGIPGGNGWLLDPAGGQFPYIAAVSLRK